MTLQYRESKKYFFKESYNFFVFIYTYQPRQLKLAITLRCIAVASAMCGA